MENKICEWCGKEYERPHSIGIVQWRKRRFCCHSCSTKASRTWKPSVKECRFCGCSFTRRYGDSDKQWKNRKYCSRKCTAQAKAKENAVPIEQRFWCFVKKRKNGCWSWIGSADKFGYGRISTKRGKSPKKAHRLSWEIHFGKIKHGLFVCHACDNPNCVNPDHLLLGTQKANIVDMAAKGRVNKKSYRNLIPGTKGVVGAVKSVRI